MTTPAASTISDAMAESLHRVQAFFTAGTLGQKAQDAADLRARGDGNFFDGGVQWSLTVPEADKRLSGESESMDAALADIRSALLMLAGEHGEAAAVECGVRGADE